MRLPSEVTLKFENEIYSLFTSSTNKNILLGKDYEPVAVEIPLEDGETFGEVLFNSPVYYVILELKEILKIGDVDVHLDFPFLEIDFDQESTVLRQKSLADFVGFQESLSLLNDIPVSTFEVTMTKCTRSIKSRMEFLERISAEGGLIANPIFIDDSSSNSELIEIEQPDDNDTEQFDEIDQDLLSEDSVDDITGAGLDSKAENDINVDTELEGNYKIEEADVIDSGVNVNIHSGEVVAKDLDFIEIENDDGLFIIDEDVEDSDLVKDSLVAKEIAHIPAENISHNESFNNVANGESTIPHNTVEESYEHIENIEEKGNIGSPLGKREMDVLSTENPKRIRV